MAARTFDPVALALASALLFGCTSPLPERGSDGARVVIGSPTVFLRERLLTERFEDLEWLRLQRSPAKEAEYEQGFQGSARSATAESGKGGLGLGIGGAPGTTAPSPGGDEPTPDAGSGATSAAGGAPSTPPAGTSDPGTQTTPGLLGAAPDPKLTAVLDTLHAATPALSPRDKLLNRIAFRDTVAQEIRKRTLDDTHDLDGSALYELQFGLSILPGEDAGDAYAVLLEVVEPPAPTALDEDQAWRISTALLDACRAEMGELDTRYQRRAVTIRDSQPVAEAIYRGTLLAQIDNIERVRNALARRQDASTYQWRLSEETLSNARTRILMARKDKCASEALEDQLAAMSCDLDQIVPPTEDTERDGEGSGTRPPAVSGGDLTRYRESSTRQDSVAMLSAGPADYNPAPYADTRQRSEIRGLDDILDSILAKTADRASLQAVKGAARIPDVSRVPEHARRALGFAVARHAADISGKALIFNERVIAAGQDAMSLLPALLSRNVCGRGKWELPSPSSPRVVSVSPSELAEQVSTSAYSDLRRALTLALEGTFSGTVKDAKVAYEQASQELRRYELIGRNPLVVGFLGGNASVDELTGCQDGTGGTGRSTKPASTFGWVLNPRLEASIAGTAGLRYRAVAAYHSVTATLIASACLAEVSFRTRVFRIRSCGAWEPIPAEHIVHGTPANGADGRGLITVPLPRSPEFIASSIMARRSWSAAYPRIFSPHPERSAVTGGTVPDRSAAWRLRSGEGPQVLVVLGSELWRSPQVYVGGQRATRVQILPDLGGLWAEFETVRAPAGQDGAPVSVDLIVSTSRGTDRIPSAVQILPAKAEAKTPTSAGPAVQVVTRADTRAGPKVDLRFELEPPFPKSWHGLIAAIRPTGIALPHDLAIDPELVRVDPKQGGRVEILGLVLKQGLFRDRDWKPVDTLELTLKLIDSPQAAPRALHPVPLTAVIIAPKLECTPPPGFVLTAKQEAASKPWVLAEETRLDLEIATPFEPAHHELYVPALRAGAKAQGQITIGGTRLELTVQADPKAVGKRWIAVLPGKTVLAQAGQTPPTTVPFELELGALRLSGTLPMRAGS
ncbi:MAG: hypothetical protein JNK02_03835 [Planctomycetes bacterium]|nr:hypothetical protein [Planctomycetota bacterium]